MVSKPTIYEWEKLAFERGHIGRMLVKYPWILSTGVVRELQKDPSILQEKKNFQYSTWYCCEKLAHILGCSTKSMNSILEMFNDLGISKNMVVPVITSSPQLLLRKPNEFLQIVCFLTEMGFDKETVGKILCRSPEIFASNVDSTLRKRLTFLLTLVFPNTIFLASLGSILRFYCWT
ncbi:hypothetical protein HU200_011146 [Digitaria exilis]|uniref:Mitochondrial transcription termination factor n=1 Tax=Digitaria exilis TaxID=1010633 RepID=A0A835KPC5_9POAL|nr:hypothetical protein HU200_011146 [Digitaria exilis]